MSSPRILIVTNRAPYPLKDGGNLAMRAMIEGYYKAGWDVQLLTMNTLRHPVSETELRQAYAHIKVDSLAVDNRLKPWATLKNFLFSKEPNHAERFYHPAFAAKLKQVITEFKPEAIQFESIYLATYLPGIRQYSKAATIFRLHNIEFQIWQRFSEQVTNPLKKLYLADLANRLQKFEIKAWQRADLLVPITNTDADVVRKLGINTPIHVAPFGIDIVQSYSNDIDIQWNAYHIGAMDWRPKAESIQWFLNEVWPAVHKLHPELKFYFAGRNMPESFKNLNIANVICAGEVPDADAFIADKKILIVPLKSGGGIRVKILEAMAKAKIIISTGVGMQGIDAVPGLHYLKTETPADFTAALSWCLEHRREAEVIGNAAATLVKQHYNASDIMKSLSDSVKIVINNNR
ncbi:MAG: glycosyltransferase family 4 protein [Flavipsychrobacter sp.]